MRVVHLGKYYPPARGGIETHVRTLARAQAALGAQVTVLCINHADEAGHDVTWSPVARTRTREEQDEGVRVVRLGRRANVARLDVAPRLGLELLRLARSDADVVHLHLPNPTMMVPLAGLPLPGPLVVTHHSDIVRQRVLRLLVRPLEERIFSRAALVLATSPVYAERSALLRRFAAKVQVLQLGIDLRPLATPSPAARARAEALRAAHGAPLWLAVGRLVYYKALHVALGALRRAPGTLVVAGTGPLEADLRRVAREEGVRDRVVWAGEVGDEELVALYLAADALFFPSNAPSEAFGLVQVEAMAAGCPIINCRIPGSGASWVAPEGECALTVPADDPAAFGAAAARLAGDPALRARLSAGCRARAAAFGADVMAERSLRLYEAARGRA